MGHRSRHRTLRSALLRGLDKWKEDNKNNLENWNPNLFMWVSGVCALGELVFICGHRFYTSELRMTEPLTRQECVRIK